MSATQRDGREGPELLVPFVRQAELSEISYVIDMEDCLAVILRYDTGLGASTILREVAHAAAQARAVLSIHGTPSLQSVPFGALIPLLHGAKFDGLGVRTEVFRAVLAVLKEKQELIEDPGLPLVILDDAQAIDPSTAELLVTLVLSGTVKLLASHLRTSPLSEALARLWTTGSAETIELAPLSRDASHEFLQAMLEAPVALPASWYFWSSAGGNPLLLRILVAEALEDGLLTQSRGIWVYRDGHHKVGRSLREAVQGQIRGLSPEAKSALELVALAEPISAETVSRVSGKKAISELAAHRLVHTQAGEDLLRLTSPIYGEVIRHMIPSARRRILHDNLLEMLEAEPDSTEGMLRRVSWAVDSGLDVDREDLLRAALVACKLSQPTLALELLENLSKDASGPRLRAIKARAHYMLGNYSKASKLLDGGFDAAGSLEELLFGSLLRATTRLALGMPAQALKTDIAQLVQAGERLAQTEPERAGEIRIHVEQRAILMELMMLSQSGGYSGMAPLIDAVLTPEDFLSEPESRLNRSFALAMDAERLCSLGQTVESQKRLAEAFAIEHAEDYDVFFIPEMIIFRQLTTALCASDLAAAAQLLDQFFVDTGPIILTFGGGANVARGMGCIRQGLLEEAVQALLPGIETLRGADPQQLLGFSIAMAAYAAAKLGRHELAGELLDSYEEKPSMFLVTAHERAYLAAALEYYLRDGSGIKKLLDQAAEARNQSAALLELNALALLVELGQADVMARLIELAPAVDGAWVAAVLRFAKQAAASEQGDMPLRANSGFGPTSDQDLPSFTAQSFDATILAATHRPMPQVNVGTGSGTKSVAESEPVKLTRRQREIMRLALAGLSDRAIAKQLQLSIRTVEGHLYRCYAKLGIVGRDGLTADMLD